jgi:uncharacterized membrane protein YhaH (DUF805 family)
VSYRDAIASAFRQYVVFRGRARRSEYWYFYLFTVVLNIATTAIDRVLGIADEFGTGPVGIIASLAIVLPWLAVGVRRLHDTSRSGWWLLMLLVPVVGWILLIVWFATDSTPGDNQYGPSPKEQQAVVGPVDGYAQPA